MENNKCGCETAECIDGSDKDNQNKAEDKSNENNGCNCGCEDESVNEQKDDEECGCGYEDSERNIDLVEEDIGCGCEDPESNIDSVEESSGCCCEDNIDLAEDNGCGCGNIEYTDESCIDNPDKPKFIAVDDFINEFEDYAHSIGIESIGYTQLTPELLIKDRFIQYPQVIVLTMKMDEEIIKTAPGTEAQKLNDLTYAKLGNITYKLSDHLRENDFATQVAHPYEGIVNFSPLAQKANLGWIGKSGLLITPKLGPRLKISAIFVSIANLPVKDHNEHSWIPDYCEKCGKCIKACPEKALLEKETCCGGNEVEFIQKNCIGCSQGCTYCIEDCPFDQKGYEHVKNKFDKMNAKLKEKQNKKFKPELWNNWAEQNSSLFAGLVDGATIAISMAQNEERLVILEKEDNNLNVSITGLEELERPVADLMFIIYEKDMAEILNDFTSVKFIDLLSSGKINVYGLISQVQLMDKGYTAFLNRLGLSLGGGGCC